MLAILQDGTHQHHLIEKDGCLFIILPEGEALESFPALTGEIFWVLSCTSMVVAGNPKTLATLPVHHVPRHSPELDVSYICIATSQASVEN